MYINQLIEFEWRILLVPIMTCRRNGAKPLSEPMLGPLSDVFLPKNYTFAPYLPSLVSIVRHAISLHNKKYIVFIHIIFIMINFVA